MTLFDIIAQSIKKDPSKAENYAEIHRRLRLGNLMVLTAQGTPFIHSGQEYGRTKQFRDPAYKTPVVEDKVPNKSHLLRDKDGNPFDYPYFIHDSYDSSDAINKFDWTKATDGKAYPENVKSRDYMKGLIALRQSTDAFRLKSLQDIKDRVHLITVPGQNGVEKEDVVIGYQITAPNGDIYAVFVNADEKAREFNLGTAFAHLRNAEVLADENQAGPVGIANPQGLEWTEKGLKLNALTATVLRISQGGSIVAPAVEEKPEFDLSSLTQEQGQNNGQGNIPNRVVKPEHQNPAPQTKPDSAKPDAKVADADHKPSQATTDSHTEQPHKENNTQSLTSTSTQTIVTSYTPAYTNKKPETPNQTTKTSWKQENGIWYFYKADGSLATGWVKDGDTWYYLKDDGSMVTGWVKDGNVWYFLNSNGSMSTGWVKDGDTWYYLDPSGAMKENQWFEVSGKWYYVDSSGKLAVNTRVEGYLVNENGEWVS